MSEYRLGSYLDNERARIWTYRTSPIFAADEGEAQALILAEAYRLVPSDQATATILSTRRTPSGRWSAIVKRQRIG